MLTGQTGLTLILPFLDLNHAPRNGPGDATVTAAPVLQNRDLPDLLKRDLNGKAE